MMMDRFDQYLKTSQLPSPIVISKSSVHHPGSTFTPTIDYKTRELAVYNIDTNEYRKVSKKEFNSPRKDSPKRPVPFTLNLEVGRNRGKSYPEQLYDFDDECSADSIELPNENVDIRDNKKVIEDRPLPEQPPVDNNMTKDKLVNAQFRQITFLSPLQKVNNPAALKGSKFTAQKSTRTSSTPSTLHNSSNFLREGGPSQQISEYAMSFTDSTIERDSAVLPNNSYQIHNRMMGWKLTTFERRKALLDMLSQGANNDQQLYQLFSTGGLEGTNNQMAKSNKLKPMTENEIRMLQRHSESVKNAIKRLMIPQNKKPRNAKVRSSKINQAIPSDPFARIKKQPEENQKTIAHQNISNNHTRTNSQMSDRVMTDRSESIPLSPNRSTRNLLFSPDRMELLESAKEMILNSNSEVKKTPSQNQQPKLLQSANLLLRSASAEELSPTKTELFLDYVKSERVGTATSSSGRHKSPSRVASN